MALTAACATRPAATARPATLQALPLRRRPFAAAATVAHPLPRLQPAMRRWSASWPAPVVCSAEQEDGTAGEGRAPVARKDKLHGPCANPHCGATESRYWLSAPGGLEGAMCIRCYKYQRRNGILPDFAKRARGPKLHGPCANSDCRAAATPQWFSAPDGLEGAICARCYHYSRRAGCLPSFPKQAQLHGPCTNPACNRANSQLWYSAPPGVEHQGAICQRCYMYARRRGVLPIFATGAKAVRHGPCSNPECGASESHRWHAAPPNCGIDGAVCSKCFRYFYHHGRLPAFTKQEAARAAQRQAMAAALARAAAADPPLLTEREARVLRLRHGLEGGQDATLAEVGRALGVSRERARQIQARAMEKLERLAAFLPE